MLPPFRVLRAVTPALYKPGVGGGGGSPAAALPDALRLSLACRECFHRFPEEQEGWTDNLFDSAIEASRTDLVWMEATYECSSATPPGFKVAASKNCGVDASMALWVAVRDVERRGQPADGCDHLGVGYLGLLSGSCRRFPWGGSSLA